MQPDLKTKMTQTIDGSPTLKTKISWDRRGLFLWLKGQVQVLVQRYQQHHMKSWQHPQATWDTQQLNKDFFRLLFILHLWSETFTSSTVKIKAGLSTPQINDSLGSRICVVGEIGNSALKMIFTFKIPYHIVLKSSVSAFLNAEAVYYTGSAFWKSYVNSWLFWPWRSHSPVLPWRGFHPKARHPMRGAFIFWSFRLPIKECFTSWTATSLALHCPHSNGTDFGHWLLWVQRQDTPPINCPLPYMDLQWNYLCMDSPTWKPLEWRKWCPNNNPKPTAHA